MLAYVFLHGFLKLLGGKDTPEAVLVCPPCSCFSGNPGESVDPACWNCRPSQHRNTSDMRTKVVGMKK